MLRRYVVEERITSQAFLWSDEVWGKARDLRCEEAGRILGSLKSMSMELSAQLAWLLRQDFRRKAQIRDMLKYFDLPATHTQNLSSFSILFNLKFSENNCENSLLI
jgi:hypothetical protein